MEGGKGGGGRREGALVCALASPSPPTQFPPGTLTCQLRVLACLRCLFWFPNNFSLHYESVIFRNKKPQDIINPRESKMNYLCKRDKKLTPAATVSGRSKCLLQSSGMFQWPPPPVPQGAVPPGLAVRLSI